MIGAQDVKPETLLERLKACLNSYLEISWLDASFEFQVDKDDVDRVQLPSVATIGKNIRVDEVCIVLAAEELPDQFRSVTLIPLSLIKDFRLLR